MSLPSWKWLLIQSYTEAIPETQSPSLYTHKDCFSLHASLQLFTWNFICHFIAWSFSLKVFQQFFHCWPLSLQSWITNFISKIWSPLFISDHVLWYRSEHRCLKLSWKHPSTQVTFLSFSPTLCFQSLYQFLIYLRTVSPRQCLVKFLIC